jgi:hypothetical protein
MDWPKRMLCPKNGCLITLNVTGTFSFITHLRYFETITGQSVFRWSLVVDDFTWCGQVKRTWTILSKLYGNYIQSNIVVWRQIPIGKSDMSPCSLFMLGYITITKLLRRVPPQAKRKGSKHTSYIINYKSPQAHSNSYILQLMIPPWLTAQKLKLRVVVGTLLYLLLLCPSCSCRIRLSLSWSRCTNYDLSRRILQLRIWKIWKGCFSM